MVSDLDILRRKIELLETRHQQAESRLRRAERRMRLHAGVALIVTIGAICLSPANRSAVAAGSTVTLDQLVARVTALGNTVTALQTTVAHIQLKPGPQGPVGLTGPQGACGIQGLAGVSGVRGPQGPAGTPADMTCVAAVEAKTQFMAANAAAKTTTFTGCNVLIQNGLGATNSIPGNPDQGSVVNGLGNLIIGYNRLRSFNQGDVRTGSHNLILGDKNSYGNFGGIVAGNFNTLSAPYTTITGGDHGVANGFASSITGGCLNQTQGFYASVTGGLANAADGLYSTVSGGELNAATGSFSSVSGGSTNGAAGDDTSISGGFFNSAGGSATSVSGGTRIQDNRDNGWSAGAFHSP